MVVQDELKFSPTIEKVKKVLDRVSRIYEPQFNQLEYDLLIVAVPRFPAELQVSTNIEDLLPVAAVIHAAAEAALEDETNRREKAMAILARPDPQPLKQVSHEHKGEDGGEQEG